MDAKKEARDLCEVLGIPFEDAGTSAENWIRQFAAKVLREAASEPFIENCGANSFLIDRAKEIAQ